MAFDRLTWVGLMIVALGWAMLLSGATAVETLSRLLGHPAALSVNLNAITQPTILTGFGLAILGALQTGFSALRHFFDTVLERTARPVAPIANEMPRQDVRHDQRQDHRQDHRHEPRIDPRQDHAKVVERGLFKDRPYIRFGDGTIEVETLLGMRRFTSLQDAYEFIGH
jgi:hypothetical protein